MFHLIDNFAIDDAAKVIRTPDGYLTAMPRVARTGIQLYRGSEVGKPDMPIVRVFRSEDEVFRADSLHSFAHRPFTDDHPPEPVKASNWKLYGRGQAGGEVVRDGEFIRVPMVLMDANTIKKFDGGKAELSVGYSCDIKFTPGTTPTGEMYDAVQTDIRANHIAVVDAARGGPKLRIGDGSGEARLNVDALAKGMTALVNGHVAEIGDACDAYLAKDGKSYPILTSDGSVSIGSLRAAKTDAIVKGDGDIVAAIDSMLSQISTPDATHDAGANQETITMPQHIVDGIAVEMSDTANQVVQRALAALLDGKKALEKKVGETEAEFEKRKKEMGDQIALLTTTVATKDAEIVTLKAQVDAAALTPAKLDQLVADRKIVADKARVVVPTVVVDGKSDAEIRAQVVTAKLGDACKGWSDDQIKISFDTLVAGVDLSKQTSTAPAGFGGYRPGGVVDQAAAFAAPPANQMQDSEARYAARDKRLSESWKDQPAKH